MHFCCHSLLSLWESERCVILLGLVDAFLEALNELLPASVVCRLVVGQILFCSSCRHIVSVQIEAF